MFVIKKNIDDEFYFFFAFVIKQKIYETSILPN